MRSPVQKYRPFPAPRLRDRRWPDCSITKHPIWCSVDLRDGNQALATPMSVDRKMKMFRTLVSLGFRQIEVGFPAASATEFQFVRELIEKKEIPEEVTIQVLVPAREELIERTVESLRGAGRVIIHMYNSTSPAQRRIVFGMKKSATVELALRGTRWIKDGLKKLPGTDVRFQYSPESFSATEIEFSIEICAAVMEAWGPTAQKPIILNLPETVEMATPNVYADQVEIFCRNIPRRDLIVVSLHTHNDRGTGVAATELGLLAGADRVEGTLFGNGERTGNLDIITAALNLHTHGIPCGLNLENLEQLKEVYESCTGMKVPPRHPYAGELAYTAFSGSHQDAIRKGFADKKKNPDGLWEIPYLPIDPKDIGREYKEVIRVNSQSGKGGVAHLLEEGYGIELPKGMQREFGAIVNEKIDALGREITAKELWEFFVTEYIRRKNFTLLGYSTVARREKFECEATIYYGGCEYRIEGSGNGPIDAFINSLKVIGLQGFELVDYREQSLDSGADAKAICFICLKNTQGTFWGADADSSIEKASVKAILSALNRMLKVN